MSTEKTIKKKIVGKTKKGTEFSIHFWNNNIEETIAAYYRAKEVSIAIEAIDTFREKSNEVVAGLFVPRDGEYKNQMEKICIAAAASYPRKLISEFIEKTLDIPFNSYKVYATAKEHDSSKYLSLDDKKGISISIDGILWLRNYMSTIDGT